MLMMDVLFGPATQAPTEQFPLATSASPAAAPAPLPTVATEGAAHTRPAQTPVELTVSMVNALAHVCVPLVTEIVKLSALPMSAIAGVPDNSPVAMF